MSHPIQPKMNTVFVHVTDLSRSVRWYSQLLDRSVKDEDVRSPVYTFSLSQHTSLTLDAGPSDTEPKTVEPLPYPLFNIYTRDVKRAYSFAREKGLRIAAPVTEFEDLSFFNLYDPDRNIIMICNG
ncbi:hypothetical protein GCM10010954_36370 [Halobacillus andaensis]|uniref:VOC domain-containing protein n=1 Tax=Halobacillus andaensis TaxID=1176239 RepID=A0A917BD50_HALAA|nr:VOC family protein [Halobacillus andaensis]MBP2006290.1 putative enzyme related to lactoylglutathione lyase [Halobacillus andaensis]GGF34054.1 hypothetical protein GCM10010954_36370 [Halobacillus andaensis]